MAEPQKKVVLVTGASSGIGRACAELLAAHGYRVYGASRRPVTSPPAEAPIKGAGQAEAPIKGAGQVEPIVMDVRDDASVRDAVTQVIAREGRIDMVVNNAGIAIAGAVEDTAIEEARGQFDVNFFGVLRVCRAVLPFLREQRAGYIVNISSIAGLVAVPYQGLYSASKFALEGLSESLRLEVSRFGVHVVLIEPGDYRTGLTANRRKTAASESNPVYAVRFYRAVERMAADEQNGPEPDAVARLLLRIVTNPRPRLRYTTGPMSERAAIWLKRLMPYSLVEKVMDSWYFR